MNAVHHIADHGAVVNRIGVRALEKNRAATARSRVFDKDTIGDHHTAVPKRTGAAVIVVRLVILETASADQ